MKTLKTFTIVGYYYDHEKQVIAHARAHTYREALILLKNKRQYQGTLFILAVFEGKLKNLVAAE